MYISIKGAYTSLAISSVAQQHQFTCYSRYEGLFGGQDTAYWQRSRNVIQVIFRNLQYQEPAAKLNSAVPAYRSMRRVRKFGTRTTTELAWVMGNRRSAATRTGVVYAYPR
jgi:hypothetical protein